MTGDLGGLGKKRRFAEKSYVLHRPRFESPLLPLISKKESVILNEVKDLIGVPQTK